MASEAGPDEGGEEMKKGLTNRNLKSRGLVTGLSTGETAAPWELHLWTV